MQIDLNCDLGEGCPHDAELMSLISSANIACGWHAGDPATALTTLRLAARHAVSAGAHPSFPDREHFGRRELERIAPPLDALEEAFRPLPNDLTPGLEPAVEFSAEADAEGAE